MKLPPLLDKFLSDPDVDDVRGDFIDGGVFDATWTIGSGAHSYGPLLTMLPAEVRRISWSFRLGRGNLLDSQLRVARRQCQKTFAAVIEDVATPSLSPKHIEHLHGGFLAIVEHVAFNYPDEFKRNGLFVLTFDRIENFLSDYRKGGVAATGRWFERFVNFVEQQLDKSEIDDWILRQSNNEKVFRVAVRSVTGLSGNSYTTDRPDLTDSQIIRVRAWLHVNGWLDESGRLSLSRVADAIGVDKARFCRSTKRIQARLRSLETCTDYRRQDQMQSEYREFEGVRLHALAGLSTRPIEPSTQKLMFTLMESVVRALHRTRRNCKQAGIPSCLSGIAQPLQGGKSTTRTPTMPVPTALFIYDRAISWAAYTMPAISSLFERVLEDMGDAVARPNFRKGLNIALSDRSMPIVHLGSHELRVRPGDPELVIPRKGCSTILPNGMSDIAERARSYGVTLLDALTLNSAILATNIGALCVRRIDEIVTLPTDCLITKAGKTYLRLNLGKVGLDGARATAVRPIPRFLFEALLIHRHIGQLLWSALGKSATDSLPYLFWSFADRRRALVQMSRAAVARSMAFFCDLIEVPLDEKGRRWYVRSHECRRFGAMSFFRISGMESSLPALSWMMGHRNVHDTWRYVQQELTGEELTSTEVAMAHAALLNKQEPGAAEGARELERVVLRHFGTTRLTLIDPDDVDDYLGMLHRRGGFRVSPKELHGRDGVSYVIAIGVKKDMSDG